MVAEPALVVVTAPDEFTVATEASEVDQVPPVAPLDVKAVPCPEHTVEVPLNVPALTPGKTVTAT